MIKGYIKYEVFEFFDTESSRKCFMLFFIVVLKLYLFGIES